ncbi:hypothetical protein [Halalkalibacterium halodurans]|uniref:hypothetical protein n=1 Tax=Halalkalibacterium halodurans TaxID=86665 RepID=UPI002E1CEF9E|nr:hypothetical protein [Halalkalibacterium halodurans]
MEGRRCLINDATKVNIDEEVFKRKAEELMCEMFVDYVNDQRPSPVLELKDIVNTNE